VSQRAACVIGLHLSPRLRVSRPPIRRPIGRWRPHKTMDQDIQGNVAAPVCRSNLRKNLFDIDAFFILFKPFVIVFCLFGRHECFFSSGLIWMG
jgi:hypothetical protein